MDAANAPRPMRLKAKYYRLTQVEKETQAWETTVAGILAPTAEHS